jgi:uncharacterized iron-regulated membrane protein
MITEDHGALLAAEARPDTPERPKRQKRSAKQSGLYRAVWRWHFYAGLFSIPIIVMLCLTGIVYLFKPQIESVLYGRLTHLTPGAQTVSYQTQLQAVTAAYANASISSVTPPVSPSSPTVFEVTRKSAKNKLAGFARDYTVFVNPYTGHVIGHRDNSKDPVNIAVVLHGSLMTQRLLGSEAWGDRLIEIVVSWSVLLLATGVFLWWPRGKRRSSLKGVLIPRTDEKKGSRTFWRDIHAVTGILFAFVTIFFLVTGMLWTGFAGKRYQAAATKLGARNAVDASLQKGFSSTKIQDVNRSGPWATAQLPVPISGEPGSPLAHAGHHGVGLLQWDPKNGAPLDAVVSQAQDLGLPPGFAIFMPADETGSYSVATYSDIEASPISGCLRNATPSSTSTPPSHSATSAMPRWEFSGGRRT